MDSRELAHYECMDDIDSSHYRKTRNQSSVGFFMNTIEAGRDAVFNITTTATPELPGLHPTLGGHRRSTQVLASRLTFSGRYIKAP
jgi:hypothetical protein